MDFVENRPIWLQIYDLLCDRIVSGEWQCGQRAQSVREVGAQFGVNPNTVMRTYERLENDSIISNRRGVGFFVADDARERILNNRRDQFYRVELPQFVGRVRQLDIPVSKVIERLNDSMQG